MALRGTDRESDITDYTLVYAKKRSKGETVRGGNGRRGKRVSHSWFRGGQSTHACFRFRGKNINTPVFEGAAGFTVLVRRGKQVSHSDGVAARTSLTFLGRRQSASSPLPEVRLFQRRIEERTHPVWSAPQRNRRGAEQRGAQVSM